jgi:hypothetical protein
MTVAELKKLLAQHPDNLRGAIESSDQEYWPRVDLLVRAVKADEISSFSGSSWPEEDKVGPAEEILLITVDGYFDR